MVFSWLCRYCYTRWNEWISPIGRE